ncbi:MAG: type IV conjugative transfer system protein TraE [Pseudomonadota bacterium]
MDTNVAYTRLRTALRQRNMLAVAGMVLCLGSALQAYVIASKGETVILTPTLKADAAITTEAPSPEYLEQTTRDVAGLFLNRHPHNLSYFRDNILRLAHPTSHGEIEAALMATERRLLATKSSTVFYPTEIFVDPVRLTSEIRGELHTYLGPDRVKTERTIYAADWRYQSMRLWLEDFYPIELDASQAQTSPLLKPASEAQR